MIERVLFIQLALHDVKQSMNPLNTNGNDVVPFLFSFISVYSNARRVPKITHSENPKQISISS